MQGKGKSQVFTGQEQPLDTAEIVILPVCFDKTTTYQKGADKGPYALIEASRNVELYDIETDSEVFKKGIFTAFPIQEETSSQMLQNTEKSILGYLQKGKFVVTLGGEHAISYAPIRAHSEHYSSISVLQLDAHADLVQAYENNPYSHASVMARVVELEKVQNIVSVGIRSMAAEEKILPNKVKHFLAHDIQSNYQWVTSVIEQLENPVYVTIDLDVFDSSLMPATGTPEPGGLFWHQITFLLKELVKKRKVIGFDVVELCPIKNVVAPDYLAAKLVYKFLSYVFGSEK
jgi:agmatinase